jgi:hypothetical protein
MPQVRARFKILGSSEEREKQMFVRGAAAAEVKPAIAVLSAKPPASSF